MARERCRWRVNETSFIGHAQVNEGDEVTYTPPEGSGVAENLSPMNQMAQDFLDGDNVEHHPNHPDRSTVKEKAVKAAKRAQAVADEDDDADPEGSVVRQSIAAPTPKKRVVDADAGQETPPKARAPKPKVKAAETGEDDDIG